jgi:hypothetical protein
MNGFSHVPTNSVNPMFPRVVQHFEEIKKLFTRFEIRYRLPLFQEMEDHDELHEFSLTFYRMPICNLLSHRSLPMKSNILSLVFNMLPR